MNGLMIPPIPPGTDRDSQHPLGFLPLLEIASRHRSLKIFKVAPQGPMVVDVHPNCFDTQGIKHGDTHPGTSPFLQQDTYFTGRTVGGRSTRPACFDVAITRQRFFGDLSH